MDFEKILTEAFDAARKHMAIELERQPETSRDPCGFAWVTIDGTNPLAHWCRAETKRRVKARTRPEHVTSDTMRLIREIELFCGNKGDPKGWKWWKPGRFQGQAIRVHEIGARAFRDALAMHGISATVGSRLD